MTQVALVDGSMRKTSYTPTFNGFGTCTLIDFKYSRVGTRLKVFGVFKTGTPTSATGKVSLPSGLNISSAAYTTNRNRIGLFNSQGTNASAIFAAGGNGGAVIADIGADTNSLFFDYQMETQASGNLFTSQNGNFATADAWVWVDAEVEIAEWQ
jgi:hypothetical protein